MLKDAGKYLDYISIHGYWDALWQRGTKPADYLHSIAHCEEPERQIREAIDLLNQTGFGDRIKIAFDEWNLRGWHHPGFPGGGADRLDEIRERDESDRNETYTMADAVFSASFLNGCLRHANYVHMACMAPVVNVRGPLFVHPKGIVKRTTFHVLRMYSDLLEANVVEGRLVSPLLEGDGAPIHALDAVATASDDRKRVALALLNRHPVQSARWRLDFGPQARIAKVKLTTLSGDSPDAYNDIAHPERVTPETREMALESGPLELPPHSVTILQATL
jgi:alpha-N-arabinofuranosidase